MKQTRGHSPRKCQAERGFSSQEVCPSFRPEVHAGARFPVLPAGGSTRRCACGSCLVVGFPKASCVLRAKASWQLAGGGGREVSGPHRLGWGVWSVPGSCSSQLLGLKLGLPGCGWKPRLVLQPWPVSGVRAPQANRGLPTCPAKAACGLWLDPQTATPEALPCPSREPLSQPVSVSGDFLLPPDSPT